MKETCEVCLSTRDLGETTIPKLGEITICLRCYTDLTPDEVIKEVKAKQKEDLNHE
jgi:hypothetical protein